MPNRW